MTKQKRGMFRRMLDAGRKAMGVPVTHHYPDPVDISPEERPPKVGRYRIGKVREPRLSAVPPCEPGTISFHDKCVRYYGRRKAEVIRRDIQHRDKFGRQDRLDRVPTNANFAAMTPWAWRKS